MALFEPFSQTHLGGKDLVVIVVTTPTLEVGTEQTQI